jgi:hypothetical protein
MNGGPDDFQEWQSFQRRRNFSKRYIVSLIWHWDVRTWTFAGVYEVQAVEGPRKGPEPEFNKENFYEYKTKREVAFDCHIGMEVEFTGKLPRNAYLLGERALCDKILVRVDETGSTGFRS